MIQWSHPELVEWAQIASNYEETTYHAEELMFDYSQKEEIESPGTGEKVTKWPPKHAEGRYAWAMRKQNQSLEKPSVTQHRRHSKRMLQWKFPLGRVGLRMYLGNPSLWV